MFHTYLADTSSLINLAKPRVASVRLRFLTRLLGGDRLRLPDAVARELCECNDDLGAWANRHSHKWLKSTNQNTQALAEVCRGYSRYLLRQDKKNSADPVVISMAIYYKTAEWVVLADDPGIQAVCLLEKLPYCTSHAFRMLEAV
jgi:hypothetical protein